MTVLYAEPGRAGPGRADARAAVTFRRRRAGCGRRIAKNCSSANGITAFLMSSPERRRLYRLSSRRSRLGRHGVAYFRSAANLPRRRKIDLMAASPLPQLAALSVFSQINPGSASSSSS